MSRAFASTVIEAAVDDVWAVVRDFAAVGRWIPGAQGCDLVPVEAGENLVRRIVLADGKEIEENLVVLDDVNRRICYAFVPPLPRSMRSFLGTAHVRPVTDGDRAYLEWMSEFDCEGDREQKMIINIGATLSEIVTAVSREVGRSS